MTALLTEAQLSALAEAAVDAARQASKAILEVYGAGPVAEEKSDGSPVTEADRRAEAIILPILAKADPTIPTVAEESVEAGQVPDVGAGRFWLVDPLDGTKEFVRRNGEFTVNIGLIDGGRPRLGVLLAPVLDRLYVGIDGLGAWRQDGDGPRKPVKVRQRPDGPLTVVASRSHRDAALEDYLGTLELAESISAGSALKICLVAEGAADHYPRTGPTMEWDTAAGHAILLAAGGSMTTWDGAPFSYAKPTFRNPGFLVWGGAPPTR